MRCVSLTLTGLVSAWRRGEAPSAILAKPLSDCVTLFCLRQCKWRHLNVCEIKKRIHAIFKQIEYLAFLTEVCVVMLWVTPVTRVVVVRFFFQRLLHQIGGPPWRQKWKSASANKYSFSIQAMISFIFVKIYVPKVTFSVLWIERTWWIKSLQSKIYWSVFLSRAMRWVMILWWLASKKTLTAEILIWRVAFIVSVRCTWLVLQSSLKSFTMAVSMISKQWNMAFYRALSLEHYYIFVLSISITCLLFPIISCQFFVKITQIVRVMDPVLMTLFTR